MNVLRNALLKDIPTILFVEDTFPIPVRPKGG